MTHRPPNQPLRRAGPDDPRQRTAISRTNRTIRTVPPPYRWECPCQHPPVLLATYDTDGRINIKVKDRYWHVYGFGRVEAICPRCAAEHALDLQTLASILKAEDDEPSRT